MQTEQQRQALTKLRDIQGTPLGILVAMFIIGRPVRKKELATVLRRSEPTVSEAVDFLELEGYVIRVNYRAWALANGQMLLLGLDLLPSETQKSLVSGVRTIHTTTTNNKEKEVVGNKPETKKTLVSEELAKTLEAIRIGGAAVSKGAWPTLAALEWVTPGYLEDMAAWVNEHDDPKKQTVGFFVHCVKSGDIVPTRDDDTIDPRVEAIRRERLEEIRRRDAARRPPGFWIDALNELQLRMTQATFDYWLRDSTAAMDGRRVVIGLKNEYAVDWVSHRLADLVAKTLAYVIGDSVEIAYQVRED